MYLEPHSNGRHSIYTPVCRDEQRERHLQTEMRKYTGFCAFLRISPFPIQAPLPGSILVFRFLFLREGENTAGIASDLPVWPRGPPILAWRTAGCRAETQNSWGNNEHSPLPPWPCPLPSLPPLPPSSGTAAVFSALLPSSSWLLLGRAGKHSERVRVALGDAVGRGPLGPAGGPAPLRAPAVCSQDC